MKISVIIEIKAVFWLKYKIGFILKVNVRGNILNYSIN